MQQTTAYLQLPYCHREVAKSACSSSTKLWGWAVAQRWWLNAVAPLISICSICRLQFVNFVRQTKNTKNEAMDRCVWNFDAGCCMWRLKSIDQNDCTYVCELSRSSFDSLCNNLARQVVTKRTSKLGEWVLVQGWVLAWDNTVLHKCSTNYIDCSKWRKIRYI